MTMKPIVRKDRKKVVAARVPGVVNARKKNAKPAAPVHGTGKWVVLDSAVVRHPVSRDRDGTATARIIVRKVARHVATPLPATNRNQLV